MLRRLTILALALPACTASNSADNPMIVLGNSALVAGTITCTFTGDVSQPTLSQGMIASQSPEPYLLTPLLQSRLTALMNQELTKTISIQGADVTLSAVSAGAPALPDTSFQVLAAGFLAPNGGTANISFDLIPVTDLKAIDAALGTTPGSVIVQASIKVHGELGGDRVESEPFVYGVTVCNNCVIVNNGTCPVKTAMVRAGNPCNIFQDGAVDCCELNGVLECPGPTM
ncbi:MAG: hypothetical protein ACM31C_10085 [Acidobacteriota bacterium]